MEMVGTVHEDTVVAAGAPWSGTVSKGDVLRVIDLEGLQAVDLICFNAKDRTERYDSTVTVRIARSTSLNKGDILYSNLCTPLLTLEEDTVGRHDTIAGCCSREINLLRYNVDNTPSCRANFLAELARHGMDGKSLVPNVNFFMYVPVDAEGRLEIKPGLSKAGDYIDLRAETDTLVVISNCPQTLNPANGFEPTPIRIINYSKPPK